MLGNGALAYIQRFPSRVIRLNRELGTFPVKLIVNGEGEEKGNDNARQNGVAILSMRTLRFTPRLTTVRRSAFWREEEVLESARSKDHVDVDLAITTPAEAMSTPELTYA